MPGEYPRRAGLAVTGGRNDFHAGARFGGTRLVRLFVRSSAGRLLGATSLSTLLLADIAVAQTDAAVRMAGLSVDTFEVMQMAMFTGVMGAALISAIVLIRERARTSGENAELRTRIADLNAALQRSEALLNLRDQRVVVDRREAEAGTDRDTAGRDRRARGPFRLPGIRTLADAALGRGAGPRNGGTA